MEERGKVAKEERKKENKKLSTAPTLQPLTEAFVPMAVPNRLL